MLANAKIHIFGLLFVTNIYMVFMYVKNTNRNIMGLTKNAEYEYKYIWVDKKGQIQIQI